MSVTHWQLLAEERERRRRRDENKARSDLGYPVPARMAIHPGSSFGPHAFVPFADSERHKVSCVRCGRRAEHPIHQLSEAA
jgi:hypothetical protein